MSYTVVDTIIKSELDIVARKDGRSKNLYMRKRNANGKAIYTYISLKTKDKVDAKKLARTCMLLRQQKHNTIENQNLIIIPTN